MLFKNILLAGAGGMLGTILRYLVSFFIRHNDYPYATFTVNIAGSFILGVVMGLAARNEGFGSWRLFLATGICGGFTTFSSFAWENLQLLTHQRYGIFFLYVSASMVLGLTATGIGYWITK